jgi:hypothetical protein
MDDAVFLVDVGDCDNGLVAFGVDDFKSTFVLLDRQVWAFERFDVAFPLPFLTGRDGISPRIFAWKNMIFQNANQPGLVIRF